MFRNDRATALKYYEANWKLARAACWRFRSLISHLLPREDWNQIAALCFWRACLTYNSTRGKLSTWAYRIANQDAPAEFAKYIFRPHTSRLLLDHDRFLDTLDPTPTSLGIESNLDELVDAAEWWSRLDDYLTIRQADTIRRRCKGESQTEIARMVGTSRQNIEQAERTAMTKLRKKAHLV